MTVGQLFDRTGKFSAKELKKLQSNNVNTTNPPPSLLPKTKNKLKLNKVKKKREHNWKDLGEILSKVGTDLGDAQASESAKTQQLKDQLYIRRSSKLRKNE